jgi:hypothetical protein
VLNQLASPNEQPDGSLSDALVVESAIVKEFEVAGQTWNYPGMKTVTPAAD